MARFARRGFENRKVDEATPWTEMKKNSGVKKKNFSKDQSREERRMKRREERESKTVCFNCRTGGHRISDCPFLTEANQQGTCFKCGSTEHIASSCSVKIPKDSFPFAQCFICGEKGHISKNCQDNPRGLYPKGGCCKQCGSVEHLKRDCPAFLENKAKTEITVDTIDDAKSADAEPVPTPLRIEDTIKKKKNKVVKF